LLGGSNLEQGDYIFYGDESGDHSLTAVDNAYPVFVLSVCAFRKDTYCRRTIPRFLKFKFDYFGHDAIVLHERDIRKQVGDFGFLADLSTRERFVNELSDILQFAPFSIFSTIIDKRSLRMDLFPDNPYAIALRVCLQGAYLFLKRKGQLGKVHHFIFEKRGAKEDKDLELEFRRIVGGENDLQTPFEEFHVRFSDKRTNSTGMQIADLTARPIGLKVFRPNQQNRAFDIIQGKLFGGTYRFGRPARGITVLKKRKASDYSKA
jgi:hypothetical protein